MKKRKKVEQPLFVYRYKIVKGCGSKVEAELNKLAVANPLGIKIIHVEDYFDNEEMMLVVKITKLNKNKGEWD